MLCAGSRSSPLTVAIAQHPRARVVLCIDERSLGFWAMGYGRATGRPAGEGNGECKRWKGPCLVVGEHLATGFRFFCQLQSMSARVGVTWEPAALGIPPTASSCLVCFALR